MKTPKIPGGNELLNPRYILEKEFGLTYGSNVGDFGSGGIGYFTFQAAQIVGEDSTVYTVDILKRVLKNIENRAKMLGMKNIITIWSNLEVYGGMKINDSSLDYGLLVNILFQNNHPEKILRESARVIKKNGKLLIIDWNEGRFPFGPPQDKKISKEKLNDIALGAGLKKLKDFDAGRFHYGMIFEKI